MKKNKKTNEKFISKEIKQQTFANEDYQKVRTFIILLIIVIVFLGGLYFINGKYVSKDEFQNEKTTTVSASYDKSVITVDKMFRMTEPNFMVLLYDTKTETQDMLYGSLVNSYTGENDLYSVDLSNKMNSKYYQKDGKENTKPTKKEEVVITKPTLIVFESGKVTNYITNQEEIIKMLKRK